MVHILQYSIYIYIVLNMGKVDSKKRIRLIFKFGNQDFINHDETLSKSANEPLYSIDLSVSIFLLKALRATFT